MVVLELEVGVFDYLMQGDEVIILFISQDLYHALAIILRHDLAFNRMSPEPYRHGIEHTWRVIDKGDPARSHLNLGLVSQVYARDGLDVLRAEDAQLGLLVEA